MTTTPEELVGREMAYDLRQLSADEILQIARYYGQTEDELETTFQLVSTETCEKLVGLGYLRRPRGFESLRYCALPALCTLVEATHDVMDHLSQVPQDRIVQFLSAK